MTAVDTAVGLDTDDGVGTALRRRECGGDHAWGHGSRSEQGGGSREDPTGSDLLLCDRSHHTAGRELRPPLVPDL